MGDLKKPLLDGADEENGQSPEELDGMYTKAAWMIEDALEGHYADKYPEGARGKELRELTNALYNDRQLLNITLNALLLMMWFECPLWCNNSTAGWEWLDDADRCPLPDGSTPYMSSLPIIPPYWGLVIEFACLLVISKCLADEHALYKESLKDNLDSLRREWAQPEFFLYVAYAMWADLLVYYAVRQQTFRIAPYCRLIMLWYWPRIQNIFNAVWGSMQDFCSVGFFLLGTVVFMAWVLVMVLDFVADMRDDGTTWQQIGGDGFGSFQDTLLNFFVICTGAAYPDNVVGLLKQSRGYAFVIYPFMIMTFFLFTQLMLAIVYEQYTGVVKDEVVDFFKKRIKGLCMVHKLLSVKVDDDGDGDTEAVITMDAFDNLTKKLMTFPRFKNTLKAENTEILFAALDDDGSGRLTLKEFFQACDYLLYKFWTPPAKSSMWIKAGENDTLFRSVHAIIDGGWLQICVDCLLIANFAFIVQETRLDILNAEEPAWMEPVQFFFSVIYMGETILKLLDTSFENYWSDNLNKFDFVVNGLLFSFGMLSLVPAYHDFSHEMIPWLNILRMTRLLKFLTKFDVFATMVTCIQKLVSISADMFLLLYVSTAFFGIVGVQFWGGKLYPTNPLLKDSKFVQAEYYVISFDDFAQSMMVLFNMMVAAYMPEYAQAMGITSRNAYLGEWAGVLFCSLFFFIGVNLAFNIFTAFTIDIFVSLKEAEEGDEETEDDKNLSKMTEILEERGLVLHYIVPAEVTKAKAQMDVIDDLDDEIQKAQEEAEEELASDKDEEEADDDNDDK